MPKISVIMPVYNAEKYLRECMDSILGQTLGDFEMFCINDGSTDGTAAILAEYAATDVRVKLLTTNRVASFVRPRLHQIHSAAPVRTSSAGRRHWRHRRSACVKGHCPNDLSVRN